VAEMYPVPADAELDDQVVEAEIVVGGPRRDPRPVLGTVVSDDQSPSFETVRFRLNPGADVVPGEFVVVEAGREDAPALVVSRVLDAHEVNPHEDPLSSTVRSVLPFGSEYSQEGQSTVIYRLVEAEAVEEIPLSADGTPGDPHEVRSLPRAGGLVFSADAAVVGAVLGFLSDPEDGVHLGLVHGQGDVPVVLDPAALQRHVLIVGGIGSGKSYTRGVLAEELRRLGVAQVNIDVNGELIDAATELGGTTVRPGNGFTLPLSALTSEDLIEAIAGVQRGTNIETLIGYAFNVLQREVRQNRRATFGVADLVQEIADQAPNLNMAQANTLRPAQLRTQALDRLPYIGPQFDWRTTLVNGAFVNIDCRTQLLPDLRVITAAVARDIQNLARRREIPFTVLSIDEFHLVAPNDDRNVSTQVLREIARIGRHYRLGLILTTQSPADVDRSILKRLLTRFLHAIEPDQLDALRGVFADAPQEMVRSLPKLPQGTCVLSGVAETVRHATVVDVRRRVTSHGGATPDVWADIQAAGWGPKRNLDDLR